MGLVQMHPHWRHGSLWTVTNGNEIAMPNLSCWHPPLQQEIARTEQECLVVAIPCGRISDNRAESGNTERYDDYCGFHHGNAERWWLPQPSSCMMRQQTMQSAWPWRFFLFHFFFSPGKLLYSSLCPSWALSFSNWLEILFYTAVVGMGNVSYHRHFLDNNNSLAIQEPEIHTPIWYPPEGNVHNQICSSCCWAISWNTEDHWDRFITTNM